MLCVTLSVTYLHDGSTAMSGLSQSHQSVSWETSSDTISEYLPCSGGDKYTSVDIGFS